MAELVAASANLRLTNEEKRGVFSVSTSRTGFSVMKG